MNKKAKQLREIRNKLIYNGDVPLERNNEPYKEIVLTDGSYAKVSPEKYEQLNLHTWSKNGKGYAVIMRGGKCIFMHHHTLDFDLPEGWYIDHINGDPLDNRLSNLRAVTMSQNHMNKGSFKGDSKYKGVYLRKDANRKKPWCATLKINSKIMHIGSYETEEDAARAYDDRAKFFFGEYARLNFPVGKPTSWGDVLRMLAPHPVYISLRYGTLVFNENTEIEIIVDLTRSPEEQDEEVLDELISLIK